MIVLSGMGAEGTNAAARFAIEGMTCSNCARHVHDAIRAVRGVANVRVSLEKSAAEVDWSDLGAPASEAVVAAVNEAGYNARLESAEACGCHTPSGETGRNLWGISVVTGLVPTALLMLGEWLMRWGDLPWFRWLSLALALVVQIGPGRRFYLSAWRQLRAGRSNMDTLVALGSTAAFGYSAYVLLRGGTEHLYFMEGAAIITLISVGHWMEARATQRAAASVRALLDLTPAKARRQTPSGTEEEVAVSQLQHGDEIILRPGERVPTDGQVVAGASATDESMLTGESVPVEKTENHLVYGGSIVLDGSLRVRVTATGAQTALAQIVAAVERAQHSRANIQRLGDRVSSVFVPVIVAVALGTALWWALAPEQARDVHAWLSQFLWHSTVPRGVAAAAILVAVSVLIVACPCAMGLATPAAIMAGSNAAAARGILIRDGVALEKAGQVTAVLFDKTGTLTSGRPVVSADELFPGNETRDVDRRTLAANLARPSNHPLSRAMAGLSPDHMPIEEWREIRGAGVQGKYRAAGEIFEARLGSLTWLSDAGIDLGAADGFRNHWAERGATILGLAIGPRIAGVFALADTVKPGARRVVERLQRQGLQVYIVTGDHRPTAVNIAAQIGIDPAHVLAEVRPEKKAEWVQKLQQEGQRVAFVGDGINDAPALEQADLGVAVSRASDIARESADIIILRSEIEAVPESLGLARATLRTIKQNLFWAFFYNAASVPLAALGFLSPILCAAAMGLSDLVVIGNAVRLRHWRAPAGSSSDRES